MEEFICLKRLTEVRLYRSCTYSSERDYIVGQHGGSDLGYGRHSAVFRIIANRKAGTEHRRDNYGKPVANITSLAEDDRVSERARSALFTPLRRERVTKTGRWTREDLHYDAPCAWAVKRRIFLHPSNTTNPRDRCSLFRLRTRADRGSRTRHPSAGHKSAPPGAHSPASGPGSSLVETTRSPSL